MIEIRSLRDLLRLLFIYQREFKLAALSAVVIIVLGAFLLPAKYESNARLLVKPGRDSTLPIEISNRQALVMPSTQRDPIVDEERLLTGRPIVRQVAERYLEVLANRPPPEGLWKRTKFYVKKAIGAVFDGIRVTLETFGVIEETTAVERLAKDLEKKFEVTHAAGSTVMEISFTWSEPEVAQEVVKAWIEIYMEERTQALGRKSLYAFYEAQTADSAAQIKSYKAQILKHLNEIGASSIEDRLQDLSERINVLRGERFNSIRLIASSDSALESTRQQLKGLPREIVTVRQIALNPAQQDLRRLLNQKRLERADMMRTYTDDAPPVKALDASIRALEKEVQDEGATVQSSEDRAPNTLTTHLERVLLDETSNNAALRTQLAEQEKQLAELEAQRREALDIEPTLARLQRELNATERNYALYVDSLEKSRIDRELDKSQISNISVIEEATYNPGRIFPKTLLMLFLAVPFGLAVGLLVVYLCYLLDQRIHDGGLVEEKFGLPLWTTLPELSNSTAESSNAFTASIYRLYGLLPYARIEEVAQEVVKAWIEIYMEERTQALGRKSLYAFYEAQTADSAAQIKSYKAQILKHLNEIGASSIEDRLQDLSERINVLRGERFNSIRLIASSDSALESTRQQLKGLPREIVTVRQIALNPAQQDLRRLLNQKRLERADMMRTYTDDAPPVKALDASIRALEKEVQDEGATVQSSEDRAPNTLTTHLERVLLDETSNNAALRTQLAEQEKQLAELEAQRREALDIEPTLARLQRELNATERNYALYVDSLEKSRIDRELDKSQISNISVIEEATYNPGRIFPKTLLMLFLAVPFGLAVGLLVVYLCYLLDQRIHDGGLVEEKFGLPLWTTLPELSNSTAESSNAFTASIYRLYGLLPYARIEEKGLTLGLTSARHGEGVTFIIEQLRRLLEENGVRVRVGGEPAQPGEVVLLDAPALLDSREAFIALRRADLIALVVEAQKSTVPVVEHALTILTTAFGKVDGIIINRRRFEVPSKVLQTIARYRSAF
ncbi:GumC family protein [Pseudomonas aeruginosa]|uniref:GumC family protein n=23 Tax=Gammaproteobacteria TaxID=1236 RepID=UPI003983483A